MVRHKVFTLLPQIASQPQLLSHFLHELISFDTSLRDEWAFDGGCGVDGWKGVAWEVLVKKDWFGRWLQVEKDCKRCESLKVLHIHDVLTRGLIVALSRYQNIIETKDSDELDYDSVDPGNTKPTKAAIRVNDLLETITGKIMLANMIEMVNDSVCKTDTGPCHLSRKSYVS